eukprot:514340_1
MATVFRQYLQDNHGKCPNNAHLLVDYSKHHSNFKSMEWIDAHLLIEHYMLYGRILPSDGDSDDNNEDIDLSRSETTISILSNAKPTHVRSIHHLLQHHDIHFKRSLDQHSYTTLQTQSTECHTSKTDTETLKRSVSHLIIHPQKYPTRQRRESQIVEPCCSFVDVIGLLCCTILLAVGGYVVLMMGLRQYLHSIEYSIQGQCICMESQLNCDDNVCGNEVKYNHLWRIYNDSICSDIQSKASDYRFTTSNDETVYDTGAVIKCFTNNKCDEIYVTMEDHEWSTVLYIYIGSIICVIGLCCCIGSLLCYCKLCQTNKVLHCVYCKECRDYCSGRDEKMWYFKQSSVMDEQQQQLDCVMRYYCRIYGVELDGKEMDLMAQYYHGVRDSIEGAPTILNIIF